jgi:hypothetical protein
MLRLGSRLNPVDHDSWQRPALRDAGDCEVACNGCDVFLASQKAFAVRIADLRGVEHYAAVVAEIAERDILTIDLAFQGDTRPLQLPLMSLVLDGAHRRGIGRLLGEGKRSDLLGGKNNKDCLELHG